MYIVILSLIVLMVLFWSVKLDFVSVVYVCMCMHVPGFEKTDVSSHIHVSHS